MASIAFALPVKDRDAGYKLVDELTGGKSDDHHRHNLEHGVDRVKVWRQHTPQEMVIVYLEGASVGKGAHTDFAQWIGSTLEQITGHHSANMLKGGHPSEVLMDWHRDKGHAGKGKEHA